MRSWPEKATPALANAATTPLLYSPLFLTHDDLAAWLKKQPQLPLLS